MNEGGNEGVALVENVFDGSADEFGEAHSTKGGINLGGEEKAVDIPKLPDVKGAVGPLDGEIVRGRGRGGETGGRGRRGPRDNRGVGEGWLGGAAVC